MDQMIRSQNARSRNKIKQMVVFGQSGSSAKQFDSIVNMTAMPEDFYPADTTNSSLDVTDKTNVRQWATYYNTFLGEGNQMNQAIYSTTDGYKNYSVDEYYKSF